MPYEVRRSERARRVSLKVYPNGRVEVVAPTRARLPLEYLDLFVAENTDWIRRQRERFAARAAAAPAPPAIPDRVPLHGRLLPVRVSLAQGLRATLRFLGDAFAIELPDGAAPETARRLLERWYRAAAAAHFAERVRVLNAETQHPVKAIRIGDQKRRWGSCSARGTLSFNWRLMMAPADVLDYVVIHELAHFDEMNHSARFWALVKERCPRHEVFVRWLREHAPTLAF